MQRACGLSLELLLTQDLLLINEGALAEQFVGEELLSYGHEEVTPSLFTWAREAKNSSAEIDYLLAIGSQIVPIEVKAGATGTLRSLKLFLEEKSLSLGVRLSQRPLSLDGPILSIPLYMIEQLARLVQEVHP